MTQSINLGNTNTMTFNGQNVNKLYLNNDLIWEGAYEFTLGTLMDRLVIRMVHHGSRTEEGKTCNGQVSFTLTHQNWSAAQLYYNLPTSRFSGVTKASVIDWNSATGWNSTKSPSSNKYLAGCPTTDADTGYNFNNGKCYHCTNSQDVMSYMPSNTQHFADRYRVGRANNYLIWGNSNVTNSNAPNSTFVRWYTPDVPTFYHRVGFVYSPGGYAWRNGSGGIGEMVMAFYDPTNTRVVIQYVMGSLKIDPFNAYADSWRNVVNNANVKVVIGGRNTNCPDVINSGRGWDAS